MAFPVTHIFLPMLVAALLRARFYFPRRYLLVAGFAGVLPDIDWLYEVIMYFAVGAPITLQSLWTHLIWWPILSAIIAIAFYAAGRKKLAILAALIAFGLSTHMALDMAVSQIRVLYPLVDTYFGTGYFDITPIKIATVISLDVVLVGLWLFYTEILSPRPLAIPSSARKSRRLLKARR